MLCIHHIRMVLKPYDLQLMIKKELMITHTHIKSKWHEFYRHALKEAKSAENLY